MLKIKYFIEIGSDIEIQIKPDDLQRFKEPVEEPEIASFILWDSMDLRFLRNNFDDSSEY